MPEATRPPRRVLIADDHPLMVDGLRSLLEAHGYVVAGSADNGQEALAEALRLSPDLVLMDICMPVCSGLEATRLIKARRPQIKILILTASAEDQDLFEAIKSGACGYLLKSTRSADVIAALHDLEQDIPPFSPGLANRLLSEFGRLANAPPPAPGQAQNPAAPPPAETAPGEAPRQVPVGKPEQAWLTRRQEQVLRLVAAGLTYKEVGVQLCLSEVTVRYHMGEIMRLLHLENRSQVIAYAGRRGMV